MKRVIFEDIRRSSVSINDTLYDQRSEIARTVLHSTMTLDWVPLSVREELEAVKNYLPASKYIGYLTESIKDTLKKAGDLDRFLMETFAPLQSSISIMEAGMSREQARRGQMLTRLAFLYVPLSFVTSIFGMNVKEIKGSPLSV